MAKIVAGDLADLGARIIETGKSPRPVAARFGERKSVSTALIFHHDTVWPIDRFPSPRREGDAWFGPGIFDMKANLPLVMLTISFLADHQPSLLEKLLWVSSPDEENLGDISTHVLPEIVKEHGCQRALVFEPPHPDGTLKQKRKGCARISVEFSGVASHAGNHYLEGKSALRAASRFLLFVEALSEPDLGLTINVGTMRGGDAVNTRPAKASMRIDVRFWQIEQWQPVHKAMEAYADPEKTGIQLKIDSFLPPMNAQHDEWQTLKGACERSGCPYQLGSAGGGSDGSRLAALGLRVMDGLGVLGAGEHANHEHIQTSALEPYFIRNTYLIMNLLSREYPRWR